MRHAPWTLVRVGWIFALLAASSGCGTEPTRPPESALPDVILIMVDTLRADRLGCYGYAEATSPNIDRFAAESLLFENALSHAADTRFSCAALLSGYLPHETSILRRPDLPDEVPTLTETLQSHGYSTAAVISNYVLRDGQGYEQGFDTYDSTMRQTETAREWPERVAEHTTDRAIEILRQSRDRPLFLWVHYQDPHGPYVPPESFVSPPGAGAGEPSVPFNETLSGRGGVPSYQRLGDHDSLDYYSARYDGEVRYTDQHLGRLIAELKEQGMYRDAVIVFSSDHGEGMGEHDYFFAHGEYLYQDQIHVPLVLRWGQRLKGRRADYVQHVDLVPTILGILELPAAESLRGRDLLDDREAATPVVSEMRSSFVRDGIKVSMVRDGLKLIYSPLSQQAEFYDIATDPVEENDLVADPRHASEFEAMMAELLRIRGEDRLALVPQQAPHEPSEEELEKLRSLGYAR